MEGKFTRARSNLDPDPTSKVPETISRTAGQGSGLLNEAIQTADLRQSVESAFLISQAQSEQDQYCEADYAPTFETKVVPVQRLDGEPTAAEVAGVCYWGGRRPHHRAECTGNG